METKRKSTKVPKARALDFSGLVSSLREVDAQCTAHAKKAVNVSLTLRNWLIGAYIHEYELGGVDRAAYGERLFGALADRLEEARVSNCNRRQLYRYLRFYRLYPEIVRTLSAQFAALLPPGRRAEKKVGTPSPLSTRDPNARRDRRLSKGSAPG